MKPILRALRCNPMREDNALFQGLLLFTLLFPLFVWFPAHDSFILPKWVLFQAFSFLALGGLLVLSFLGRPIRIPLHPINGLLVLFLVWQTASILWAASPSLARDQAGQTAALVGWALVLQNVLINRRGRLIALGWSVVLSSLVVACWALWLDFMAAFGGGRVSVRSVLGDWRDLVSAASLGNSGHVADFLVAGFLVSLALFLSTRRRRWRALLGLDLVIKAAALIVCWSVHSNLSLVVASGLLGFLVYRRAERADWVRYLRRLAPVAVAWILVALFFIADHPVNPHGSRVWADDPAEVSGGIFSQAFASERWKEGGSTRWVIWMTTLEIIKESPWLGSGAGNFTYAYPAVRSESIWQHETLYNYSGRWTNAAHNTLLQTWSEVGIIGAAILLLMVGAAFLSMSHRSEKASPGQHLVLTATIALLAAWCVQAQMNFPLELPVSSVLLVSLISVPIVLPLSGFEDAFRIPVYRDIQGLRVGVMVENVKIPIEAHLEPRLPRAAAVPVAVVLLALAAWAGAMHFKRLEASVLYRPVYEGLRNPRMMQDPVTREQLMQTARRGLERDPGHWDLRSALADLYLAKGQPEEALPHLEGIRSRLNAWEVYSREGEVYRRLGMTKESEAAWDEVFRRRPDFGVLFPREYLQWQDRHPPDG